MLAYAVVAAPDLDRMGTLAMQRYGEPASALVADWRRMLQDADAQPEQARLERVNSFFNRRIRFDDDALIWKTNDYWATPLETMGRKAGDCEDFAIAKYVSLRLLGVPADKLRLIYVRAQIGGPSSAISQAHMVVGYFPTPDAEPLVLDNLIGEIRPAARRPDLFPVFSFNDAGLWVAGAQQSSADPTARLSRWRDALQRMRADGLPLP
ncbi:MAG TPA: transglutaminase-like cysteine peptidase [Thauera sp.]|nr:transglutaminase-like cysteine peptidase [Thauera sp.]